MITPEEITRIARSWWKPALTSRVTGAAFFPKSIERIGRVRPGDLSDRFRDLQQRIEDLYLHSKHQTGKGYVIRNQEQTFRRKGSHVLPRAIEFESWEDYVHYLKKDKECRCFEANKELILATLPVLRPWVEENVESLTRPETDWHGVLEVCTYFQGTPRPDLYLRQLPVQVHTKFLEAHEGLIRSLLDFLLPGDIRQAASRRLAERYYLRYDEPLIRIRLLDSRISPELPYRDLSIPLSDFRRAGWHADHILITENKMNFLALPDLGGGMAIWSGGGFNISFLKGTPWLSLKDIYYWGDLDEHGFQILHQLRSLYPQARSVMMDRDTFERFRAFAVAGSRNAATHLSLLTPEESELYGYLKSLDEANRLEQEKIPQTYADQQLRLAVSTAVRK
jgi:hypothetical protein